ncbi:MAG: MBL fold metallo-hydrolase [Proteobacteria bacterium]|nr:MBL fold metallo-hydrolase [Pseudomonadota bacterium]MBU1738897.1 MBL fold metallo-hydrolase [Pseudomonadota bacterium]
MKNKILLPLVLFILLPAGCARAERPTEDLSPPAHHDGARFKNPYLPEKERGFLNYFKMRYFSGEKYADYESNAHKVPVVRADLEKINAPGNELQVTWIGHATMLIQYRGINILTDPMFSDRASPVGFAGPKRYHPPALRIQDLPRIDYIVISHNHYDHLDLASVKAIGSAPLWLVPLRLKEWFVNAGIDADRVVELDWWDSKRFGQTTITATPVQHWSARNFWSRRKTLWVSWLIRIGDRSLWYSGDTGYNPFQFKEIGNRYPDIDLGLISIGAYEPRWFMKDMHINPAEAVQIHSEIGARRSLGIQWGTFQLTAEPIDDPPIKLREALIAGNIDPEQFPPMKIGETRIIKAGPDKE